MALARAFSLAPRVLLLDEAFSAMDKTLRDVRAYVDEQRIPLGQVDPPARRGLPAGRPRGRARPWPGRGCRSVDVL